MLSQDDTKWNNNQSFVLRSVYLPTQSAFCRHNKTSWRIIIEKQQWTKKYKTETRAAVCVRINLNFLPEFHESSSTVNALICFHVEEARKRTSLKKLKDINLPFAYQRFIDHAFLHQPSLWRPHSPQGKRDKRSFWVESWGIKGKVLNSTSMEAIIKPQ